MTNIPPEIDKYDTQEIWCLTKMTHLAKKCQNLYLPRTKLSDFYKEILKFVA